MIVLHLSAPHDVNGNPRRLYLPLKDVVSSVQAVIDKGYGGRSILSELYPGIKHFVDIDITVAEYKDWISYGKEQEIIHWG